MKVANVYVALERCYFHANLGVAPQTFYDEVAHHADVVIQVLAKQLGITTDTLEDIPLETDMEDEAIEEFGILCDFLRKYDSEIDYRRVYAYP